MEALFIYYPKCSTCIKAKKWLIENKIAFKERNIVENNPSFDEIKTFIDKSSLPLKRFFNTSGILYREMNLKDKINILSEEELITILASNGMLVKRPLLILNDGILVGFKQQEWESILIK